MSVDELATTRPDQPAEQPEPRRPEVGTMLTLIHGIIAAIAAAYAETGSTLISVLAVVAALLFAAWFICRK
ncbi:hypothetical protein ACFYYL_08795 [Actinomadura geliboluensis]|uniref:hypothetical protein n=1 Tax=Actinomadura geliboluensis TaxID=882440 RepID=UPI003680D521